MKRIALQYSGELRSILDCWPSIEENFILQNPDYKVDIFLHSWIYPDHVESQSKRDRIASRIPFTKVRLESPKTQEFSERGIIPDPRFAHPSVNFLSMFYGLKQVNELRKNYQEVNNITYDYIVRLRTDILFTRKVKPIDQYDKNFIHVNWETPHTNYGINDCFAIASPDLMDKFLSVYDNMDKIIEHGAAVNPECLLGYNATIYQNLPINKKTDWRFWIYSHAIWILNQ